MNNNKPSLIYTLPLLAIPAVPAVVAAEENRPSIADGVSAITDMMSGGNSNGNDSRDNEAPVLESGPTEPQAPVVEEEDSTFYTRFESPLWSPRGEDPILRPFTRAGKLRASYFLGGLFNVSQGQGAMNAGQVAGEVMLNPFDGKELERLLIGLDFSVMSASTLSGKVGIDPMVMTQLDLGLGLGYNFDLENGSEFDARVYGRAELIGFDDRVDIGIGLGQGAGPLQIGTRLGLGLNVDPAADLRIFLDAFATPGFNGRYRGEDILGNVAEGSFGRAGISGMVELDLAELGISPRFYMSWEEYNFENLEHGEAMMYKVGCPIDAFVATDDGALRRARIMPYAGIRNRTLEKFSTDNGVDALADRFFMGAGLFVDIEGVQGMLDIRYDDENELSLALSVGGTFDELFNYE
jgi:hypothetical protein